jgi:molybdenum cofactor guanylyltransferase
MKCGGIVLCGGRSTRMGRSKALLPFGPEPMLTRVVRRLAEAVDPIVVVAAPGQPLPPLPSEVRVVRDRRENAGPLEGLAAALAALADQHVEAAYATSCDVPLLAPAFVRRMIGLADGYDVAVPVDGEFHHPLAAVYRTSVLPRIESLLAAGRLRPVFLFDEVPTRRVPIDQLRGADPQLATLTNCNRPEDYLAALAAAGFEPPDDAP